MIHYNKDKKEYTYQSSAKSQELKFSMPVLALATRDIRNQMMWDLEGFFRVADIDDIEKFLTIYMRELDGKQYTIKINFLDLFNNLAHNMPGGGMRTSVFIPLDKIICTEVNISDYISQWHSEKRASWSLRDFFTVIDQTIEECWFTLEGVQSDYEYVPDKTIFYEIIWPIYIALRRKWYTHIDLMT